MGSDGRDGMVLHRMASDGMVLHRMASDGMILHRIFMEKSGLSFKKH